MQLASPTTQLARFDRNLADNIFDFKAYGKDEVIIKNILAYFAKAFQSYGPETLFGQKVMRPQEFARTMGYKNYRSVMVPCADPVQFQGKSKEQINALKEQAKAKEIILWDTQLCNALYKIFKYPMVLSNNGKTPNGMLMDELKQIVFLKSLTKFYHPKTHEIYYHYELHDIFLNNLARYFFKMNLTVFSKLRKSGLQDFYLRLISFKELTQADESGNITIDHLSFDELTELSGTTVADFSEQKRYINNSIKRINKIAGETVVNPIVWMQNGRFSGKPILLFSRTQIETEQRKIDHKERFDQYMFHNLKNQFRVSNPFIESEQVFKQTLAKWLLDPNENSDLKQKTFLDTYIQCFGKKIDRFDNKVFNYLRFDIPKMKDIIPN